MLNLRILALLLLTLTATLLPAPLAARQQPALTLEVRAGHDGAGFYRVGHWFPVSVIAANDGGDLRGVIEWRFPGDEGATFRQAIDLPRGARKQITMAIVETNSARTARVSLLVNGAEQIRQNVRLNVIANEQLVVGVLSSEPALLNSLGAIQNNNGFGTTVVHLDPALLPSDPLLLAALDALFVHDLATADLSESQRTALERWVSQGGTLVVGGGAGGERSVAGLADLLPVEVGPLQAQVASAPLGALAGRSDLDSVLPNLTASAVTLRPGARSLDQGNLLVGGDLGAGRVLFAAFDLAALRAWAGESDLWARVLRIEPRMLLGTSYRMRSENLLRDSLDLPALQLPSPALLLLLILIYIVVIGPVNFLTLRRMGRIELAWITTPVLVVIFLGVAYGASFVLRGTSAQISQLAVVQSREGQPGGQATAFVGLFSPQRRSYALSFAPDALVSPGAYEGFQFRSLPVTVGDSATTIDELLVDVSSLRTLLVEQQVSEAATVASALQRSGGRISGEVRNTGGVALRDALIVVGEAAQQLGDLAPGAAVTVNLGVNQRNFPDQITYSTGDIVSHEQVLYSLFGYDRFAASGPNFQGEKGIPDPDGVYLIGWSDQPALQVRIDGSERQQGATLHIIRLATP